MIRPSLADRQLEPISRRLRDFGSDETLPAGTYYVTVLSDGHGMGRGCPVIFYQSLIKERHHLLRDGSSRRIICCE